MVGRLEDDCIVFQKIQVGARRGNRVRVERSIKPICLEHVDQTDFKWLCSLSDKKIDIGYGRTTRYKFVHYKNEKQVFLSIGGRVRDNYESFSSPAFYDGVTNEITRLQGLLDDFRRSGQKLYRLVYNLLMEIKEEL